MKIPKYIMELLVCKDGGHIQHLLNVSTNYDEFPADVLILPGYLYRLDMRMYQHPRCFPDRVHTLVSWIKRNGGDSYTVKIVQDGWNTHAYITITDPIALFLEKRNLIGGIAH
jgi:hypothetical protein